MSNCTSLVPRTGTIYMITAPSGRSYIGQTRAPLSVRIGQHKTPSSACFAVSAAIKKYGFSACRVFPLMVGVPAGNLNLCEGLCVSLFGTLAPNGYNLHPGGNASVVMSDVVRRKISSGNSGKVRTPEMVAAHSRMLVAYWSDPKRRAEQSARCMGRKASPETKAKLSELRKGPRPAWFGAKISAAKMGNVPSPETRAKISATLTGRKPSAETAAKRAATFASPEYRARISAISSSRIRAPHSAEARANMSKAARLRRSPQDAR